MIIRIRYLKKKGAARNVIQDIVKSFFVDSDTQELYDYHYKNKKSRNEPKYKNRYGNLFFFLIEKKIIKRNLKSAFEFIWSEASEFGDAHKNMYGKGLDNTTQFHIFLNQILEWYLPHNNKTTEYLIPYESKKNSDSSDG